MFNQKVHTDRIVVSNILCIMIVPLKPLMIYFYISTESHTGNLRQMILVYNKLRYQYYISLRF